MTCNREGQTNTTNSSARRKRRLQKASLGCKSCNIAETQRESTYQAIKRLHDTLWYAPESRRGMVGPVWLVLNIKNNLKHLENIMKQCDF